ncbi:MAG TPA: hypothetical protein VMS56_07665 [Thermoanaerobaculia bacterium]|nr:hypothetical protein [Thermoanaerobaculia bacterium]
MRFPWSYSKRVVAGAIFGLYMAHLLYYLNPQIDITAPRLIAVTLIYGVLCGLIFGSILWWSRSARFRLFGRDEESDGYRPHGFGFVVAAAFISALVYWAHLAALRIYLPRGAIRILSKATTVIAVTAALLLILWLFERTASRRTSRILFTTGVALIFVSSFFLYQRREGYRTEVRAPVVATVAVGQQRPTVLVAMRDLPYDWIITLRGEGSIPFLSEAIERGFFTRVEPFRTTSPKALWASLATGKLPNRHGVTGRFSYQTLLNRPGEPFLLVPFGVGFKGWGLIPPVERISALLPSGRSMPFWRAWERLGFDASVHGWDGVNRDDQGAEEGESGETAGTAGLAESLARTSERLPAEASREIRAAVAEDVRRIESSLAAGSKSLLAIELHSVARAVRVLETERNALPPRHSPEGDAIRAVLSVLDASLARLAETADTGVLAIVSPTAPHPPVLPGTIPTLVRAVEELIDPGADDGFLLLLAPGAAPRANAPGIEVVDVIPTLLFAAGLPVGRDMDGRVVTEAFTDPFLRGSPISLIQSYESERLLVRRPDPVEPLAPQSPPQVSVPRS